MGDLFGKDSSPPPAPDYAGAARTQGASNLQTAIAQGILNRPNEVTPYGSRSWSQYGSTTIPGAEGNPAVDVPLWQSNINLTPLGQKTFDTQQRISDQLGGMAETGLNRVSQATSAPFGIREAQDVLMQSLRPEMDRKREQTQTALLTRGHNRGGEAYGTEMERLSREEDALRVGATKDALQMALALRNQPLNELNSLRTGAQVNLPQFGQTQAGQIGQTPIFGAAQAQGNAAMQGYNAGLASDAAAMQGLFGLGGAILGAPMTGGSSIGGTIFGSLMKP